MTHDQALVIPFFIIGLAAIVLARPINAAMIRLAEWQLKAMKRRPWGVWYFRALGFAFLLFATTFVLSPAQH